MAIARYDRGQALPLFLVLAPFLLLFISISGEVLRRGSDSIRLQRHADEMAMVLAHEQTEALNALAALNWNLHKISQRAGYYDVVMAAAAACTPLDAVFGCGPCCRAFTNLSKGRFEFRRKLRRMAQELVIEQENIQSHAEHFPPRFIRIYNLAHHEHQFSLNSKDTALPIFRPSQKGSAFPQPLILRDTFKETKRITVVINPLHSIRDDAFSHFLRLGPRKTWRPPPRESRKASACLLGDNLNAISFYPRLCKEKNES